jgi:ZIP family zinc transporter
VEARTQAAPRRPRTRSTWIAGLLPLVVLAAAIASFVALDAPGLERNGVPVEDLAVERTVLRPGEIELRVRNEGPDPVEIEQAIVNDGFAAFGQTEGKLDRLETGRVEITYPWIEGEAYEIALLTATGGTVSHSIDVAAETPEADTGFFGLMALIGIYVGVIPVAIGMLWLPWVRTVDPQVLRFLLALTVGLLVFLGVDALLEGTEVAGEGSQALGGAALVYLGGLVAYLALAGVDAWLRARQETAVSAAGSAGVQVALLVAIGIGLHNLGEGLAIGSAYAIGSLALGASLVVGFALHNTTEGLAIVAPASGAWTRPRRLVLLGAIAGTPAILGAWVGAAAFDPSLAAFMLGLGAGAIAQVIVQIAPSVRDEERRFLNPVAVGGLVAGLLLMYATGLLISV